MNQFKFHPFSFSLQASAYFCLDFPIHFISKTDYIIDEQQEKVLSKLIEDVKKNGIEKPIILEFKNQEFQVLLGKKRLQAALKLEILTVKAIVSVCEKEIVVSERLKEIKSISQRLQDSQQIVEIFGGIEKIDMKYLCLDEKNRLICVGSDHENWASCQLGKNPLEWCKKSDQ